MRVLDAAVEQAYKGSARSPGPRCTRARRRRRSTARTARRTSCRPRPSTSSGEYLVAIKGPLTTPVGEGFRSLNVTLRQELDLYVCLRPVRYFKGVPSPVKRPEKIDMVIFRENTEDIYAGIEWLTGTPEARRSSTSYQHEMGVKKIRFPKSSSIGIKPISKEGSERLIRAAMRYAIENNRRNVTLVHKGNIQKYTEGMFMKWGYALAKREFSDRTVSLGRLRRQAAGGEDPGQGRHHRRLPPADPHPARRVRRDRGPNLTGDLISDALAAQVGGIGIAPGGNINYDTGHALFEATHGTAPKYAGQDKVNPGSVILSGEMMLRYMGWTEAADRIITGPRDDDRPEGGDLRLRPPDGRGEGGQVLRA